MNTMSGYYGYTYPSYTQYQQTDGYNQNFYSPSYPIVYGYPQASVWGTPSYTSTYEYQPYYGATSAYTPYAGQYYNPMASYQTGYDGRRISERDSRRSDVYSSSHRKRQYDDSSDSDSETSSSSAKYASHRHSRRNKHRHKNKKQHSVHQTTTKAEAKMESFSNKAGTSIAKSQAIKRRVLAGIQGKPAQKSEIFMPELESRLRELQTPNNGWE